MKRLTFCLAIAVFAQMFTGQHAAFADLLYSTNFNAPTYSNGGLITQDGWVITGTSVVNPIAVANVATNGNVALTTTGQDVNRPFAATTQGSVYLSASINVSAATATGDYFLHLGDGGTNNFYSRIYARSSGSGFAMAMGTSSGAGVTYGAELAFGTEYNILARYDFVSGAANDTGALFINPVNPLGTGDTAYIAATTIGTDAISISSVNLRQGTAANAATLVIDNLSITAVPEPSSIALVAIVSLAGVGFARRRYVTAAS